MPTLNLYPHLIKDDGKQFPGQLSSRGQNRLVKDGDWERLLPPPQSLSPQLPPAPQCAQLSWPHSSSVQIHEHPLSWAIRLEKSGNLPVFRTTHGWKWAETLLWFHTNTAGTLWQQVKPSVFPRSFLPGVLSCFLERSFSGWFEQWTVYSQWFSFRNKTLCGSSS